MFCYSWSVIRTVKLRALNLMRRLSEVRVFRYLAVGGTAFVIEMSCLLAIYVLLDAPRGVAAGVAYWIGFLAAFLLQKFVAFQDYQRERRILTKQGTLYALLNLWNYAFTLTVVTAMPARYIVFSRIGAQLVFSCWDYIIYKKIIFKDKVSIPV